MGVEKAMHIVKHNICSNLLAAALSDLNAPLSWIEKEKPRDKD